MEKLLNELKTNVHEKASSPLLASFALSWTLWNYRTLIVLLSSESTRNKFEYIDNQLYPDGLTIATRGLVLPLITTALYLFVYPYPARFVYEFWLERRKDLRILRQRVDDETPLTKEQSRAVRRDAREKVEEVQHELEQERNQSAALKERVVELEKALKDRVPVEVSAERSEPAKPAGDLSAGQLRILRVIADRSPDWVPLKLLLGLPGISKKHVIYDLGELKIKKMVQSYDSGGDHYYNSTHTGLEYVLKQGSPEAPG